MFSLWCSVLYRTETCLPKKVTSMKMVEPEKTEVALEEWALGEMKNVGARNFEMSKYCFGISAGSFAIPAFFGEKIVLQNPTLIVGALLVAFSSFLALWMAEPADFKLNHNTNLSKEHERYALKVRNLRHAWLVTWLAGVFFLFAAIGNETEQRSDLYLQDREEHLVGKNA